MKSVKVNLFDVKKMLSEMSNDDLQDMIKSMADYGKSQHIYKSGNGRCKYIEGSGYVYKFDAVLDVVYQLAKKEYSSRIGVYKLGE